MFLDLYIAKLLEQYECVIVPDFGAFITNERPVFINEAEGRIYPASKRLAFNPVLTFNDGLLINTISLSEKVSYPEASDLLKKSIDRWRKILAEKQTLLLVGIGELVMNNDQKLIFTPLLTNNFLPDSFGLPDISVKSVYRISPELANIEEEINSDIEEEVADDIIPKHHHKTSKSKKVLYYSLSAYIPIIIGLWAILFFADPFNRSNESSLNPLETYNSSQKSDVSNIKEKKIINKSNPEINNVEENNIKKSDVNNNTNTNGIFYVIGGSFKSYRKAEILRNEFLSKSFKCEIIRSDSKHYRVAYSRFNNRADAENFLQNIRQNENASAWILNTIN